MTINLNGISTKNYRAAAPISGVFFLVLTGIVFADTRLSSSKNSISLNHRETQGNASGPSTSNRVNDTENPPNPTPKPVADPESTKKPRSAEAKPAPSAPDSTGVPSIPSHLSDKWEMMRRSPPGIQSVAASPRMLIAAGVSNELDLSVDQGEHWSSLPVADAGVSVAFVAFCGSYWIADGYSSVRSGGPDLPLFVSNDGRAWSASHAWRGSIEWNLAHPVCNGDTITVANGAGIFSSSDRGKTWRVSLASFRAFDLASTGSVLDAVGAPEDRKLAHCYQRQGGEWKCNTAPYAGRDFSARSVMRLGDTVCIAWGQEAYVSFNQEKSWHYVTFTPEIEAKKPRPQIGFIGPLFGKRVIATLIDHILVGDQNFENWKESPLSGEWVG